MIFLTLQQCSFATIETKFTVLYQHNHLPFYATTRSRLTYSDFWTIFRCCLRCSNASGLTSTRRILRYSFHFQFGCQVGIQNDRVYVHRWSFRVTDRIGEKIGILQTRFPSIRAAVRAVKTSYIAISFHIHDVCIMK